MAITDFSGSHAQPAETVHDTAAPLVRLAALHVEAEETARLAVLLRRTVPAAGALMLLGALTLLIGGGGQSLGRNFAWSVLVLIGVCAILGTATRAMRMPLSRAPLRNFAEDLTAALLYTGFAWGAGAFLVLPADASLAGPLLFAFVPALALTLWLRERFCVLAFLAPVAALSSFAAGLRPRPDAALEALLILAALAVVAGIALLAARRSLPAGLAAR